MCPPADPTLSATWAAAMASSGVKAVSGLAMMSSTHCANEKVVPEVTAGTAAAEAAVARTARGRAGLTIVR